jgi:hypothetical protein
MLRGIGAVARGAGTTVRNLTGGISVGGRGLEQIGDDFMAAGDLIESARKIMSGEVIAADYVDTSVVEDDTPRKPRR